MKAWQDVCGANATHQGTPTLVIPKGKTFMLQPVSFQGPCKTATVNVQVYNNKSIIICAFMIMHGSITLVSSAIKLLDIKVITSFVIKIFGQHIICQFMSFFFT